MYEGNFVRLKLESAMDGSQIPGKLTHECQVIAFDEDRDRLILLLRKGELSDIRLSARYSCCIHCGDEGICCSGEVSRRYRGEKGNIVEFLIQKGFYKININCVDK